MQEEIIVQTADEVANIDYMRNTNDIINEQTNEIQNNMDIITEQLETIIDNTNTATISDVDVSSIDVDLSEVTDLIDSIDTTMVEANTQDILIELNNQKQQINDINDKLDLILEKL